MKNLIKSLFFALLLTCAALVTQAQDTESSTETKTLLSGKGKFKSVGLMLAPSYQLSTFDGATASLINLRAGAVFGNRLTVGGFYTASLGDTRPDSETVPGIYMDYRAAGGLIEYTLMADKVVHLTFPLQIGGGEVEMDSNTDNDFNQFGESTFFMVEPAVLLEVNLHKYVRLNAGVAYRWVSDMTYRNLDQSDISGLSMQVGLKFGWFRD